MVIARQSTARTVMVGPVLDADGVAVTGLAVAAFKVSKNGGAPAALDGSATLTHRNTGHYSLALTANDLDTVGQAEIVIDSTTNACPVKVLTVVEEAVYDALFAASALGYVANAPVNVAQISGDSTAADNAEAFFDGTGYAGTNNVIPTVTTLTNDPTGVGTLLTRLGTPSDLGGGATVAANLADIEAQTDDIGAAGAGLTAVPWNAAWDAEVQSEVQDAIEANHLDHLLATTYDPASKPGAADALLNEIVENDGGVARFTANALEQAPSGGGGTADWTADERTAIRSILGIPSSGTTPDDPTTGILDTIRDAVVVVDGVVDDILADTADMQPKLGTPAGASVSADIAAVKSDTAAVLVDTGTSGVIVATNNDKTGYAIGTGGIAAAAFAAGAVDAAALNADAVDEILDEAIGDSTITVRQALRVMLAAMAGKVSGAATTTITFRNVADDANRIVATVDADGNRSAVTLTP